MALDKREANDLRDRLARAELRLAELEAERAGAELSLRRNEAAQAFLTRLSDALRPLAEASEIESTSSRLLVEHLGVNRALYVTLEGDYQTGFAVIHGQCAATSCQKTETWHCKTSSARVLAKAWCTSFASGGPMMDSRFRRWLIQAFVSTRIICSTPCALPGARAAPYHRGQQGVPPPHAPARHAAPLLGCASCCSLREASEHR